jgi:small multidrug resistance pump
MPVALSWMPWIFLSVAILFEVAGITSMKLSRGFAELLPSIGVFVFYICSAAAVILALRRLELSVAYAIWSGVGTALTAMIGCLFPRAVHPRQTRLARARRGRRGRLEPRRQDHRLIGKARRFG